MEKTRVRDKSKRKASNAKYAAAHPERVKAASMAWRKANPEKYKQILSNWYEKNKNAQRDHRQNRRSREKAVGGKLSVGLSERLYKLQKGKCPCCGYALGDDYHLDHITPISKGGTNTDGNMQLLRSVCNLQKHAQDPVTFMQSRGFLI